MVKVFKFTVPLKVTAPIELAVASCKLKVWPLPLTLPLAEILPLPLFKEEMPLIVTAPKLILLLVVLTLPFKVVVLAVLVKPLVKLNVPALPKVTPFRLLKVVAELIVFVPAPNKLTA